MKRMELPERYNECSFDQMRGLAADCNEEQLQDWARARVYFLLRRQSSDCLPELEAIASWIRDEHEAWLAQDWFWEEYVRINSRPR